MTFNSVEVWVGMAGTDFGSPKLLDCAGLEKVGYAAFGPLIDHNRVSVTLRVTDIDVSRYMLANKCCVVFKSGTNAVLPNAEVISKTRVGVFGDTFDLVFLCYSDENGEVIYV